MRVGGVLDFDTAAAAAADGTVPGSLPLSLAITCIMFRRLRSALSLSHPLVAFASLPL
jgi:hypothetical protein